VTVPDFIPEPLKKEVDIGGRKIALWVPVVGAGLAIVLVVITRLRKATSPASSTTGANPLEPAPANGPAASDQFISALTSLQTSLTQVQGNVGEQIAKAQEVFGGQVSALQTSQAALAQQVQGFQGQLQEQAGLLQGGLSGVQAAQTAFQSDVNARVAKVETDLATLNKKVSEVNTSDLTPLQKVKVSNVLYLFADRLVNPIAAKTGVPTWNFRINAQTGGFEGQPQGGYWQSFWS
jgi:hypothetical protein